MPGRRSWPAAAILLSGVALSAVAAAEDDAQRRIVGAALVDSRAWDKLAHLTDRIGHRLSGSAALERAVAWTADELRREGIPRVWTESVMVPRWVRGSEAASIVAPVERDMAVLALGGSVGTPAAGITAEVVEARSLEELQQLGESAVRGKIVLFNRPMYAGRGVEDGYGTVVKLRGDGPSAAARLGAVAMLIRSLGTADFRLPHTGGLRYKKDAPLIPGAAISVEDAELIHRLLEAGDAVRVRLQLGAKTLADAESANVLAEIPGKGKPREIVLIGAHLDSWDVGQGAHDDGAGCAIVMEALALIHRLGLQPRRTIRAVLFTNEENGLRGGKDYDARHADEHHVAAIEADSGGFRPVGFAVTAGDGGVEHVRELARPLATLGADRVEPKGGGADIGPLRKRGVPVLGLQQDEMRYFDYHHTQADTLDKVDRGDLDRCVAAVALMAWALAEDPGTLPAPPPEAPAEPEEPEILPPPEAPTASR